MKGILRRVGMGVWVSSCSSREWCFDGCIGYKWWWLVEVTYHNHWLVMQLGEAVYHTVLDSEKEAFTNHVNMVLQADPDVGTRLPITSKDIFSEVEDGVILWYYCLDSASSLTLPCRVRCLPFLQQLLTFLLGLSTTKSRTWTWLLRVPSQSDASWSIFPLSS